MPIQSVSIAQFRNIDQPGWELTAGLNVLEGENAQGKTNFLEAIYYLANCRSFRALDEAALIAWGQRWAQLGAAVAHEDLNHDLAVRVTPEGREYLLDGKSLRRMNQLHPILRVLVFTPDSTALFRGSPSARRRYFDHAISLHQVGYGDHLQKYQRVLRQRNVALEAGAPEAVLDSFSESWAELALALWLERETYLEQLLPRWAQRFRQLFREELVLRAQWVGPRREEKPLSAALTLDLLRATADLERRTRRTMVGPQRDDLEVFAGGRLLRDVGSQGQQRMVVVALKLAEADLFLEKFGRSLVFLLDDLGSELDPGHLERLLGMLGEIQAQTVLTTAQAGAFRPLGAKTFRVVGGKLLSG